jgi:hypothetical protein
VIPHRTGKRNWIGCQFPLSDGLGGWQFRVQNSVAARAAFRCEGGLAAARIARLLKESNGVEISEQIGGRLIVQIR